MNVWISLDVSELLFLKSVSIWWLCVSFTERQILNCLQILTSRILMAKMQGQEEAWYVFITSYALILFTFHSFPCVIRVTWRFEPLSACTIFHLRCFPPTGSQERQEGDWRQGQRWGSREGPWCWLDEWPSSEEWDGKYDPVWGG